MREIKFRQKTKEGCHYWGYIDGVFISPLNTAEYKNVPNDQYIGLKDKKGVEIYDGNTVKTKEGEYGEIKVSFHQGVFGVIGRDSRHYPLRDFTKGGTSHSEIDIDVEVIENK